MRKVIITITLILINVLIFVLMIQDGGIESFADRAFMLKWGANANGYTLDGQWWRLITSNFIHVDYSHLIGNMIFLLLSGIIVEPKIGTIRFTIIYLLGGTVSGLFTLIYDPFVYSIGASGSVSTLFGLMLIYSTFDKELFFIKLNKGLVITFTLIVTILSFWDIWYLVFNLNRSSVNIAGHVSGYFWGIVSSLFFNPSEYLNESYKKKTEDRFILYSLFSLVPIVVLLFVLPKSVVLFEKYMYEMDKNENEALKMYAELEKDTFLLLDEAYFETRKEYYVKELKKNKPLWKKNIAMIKSVRMAGEYGKQTNDLWKVIHEYYALRFNFESNLLVYIEKRSDRYEWKLAIYSDQIEQKMLKFKALYDRFKYEHGIALDDE